MDAASWTVVGAVIAVLVANAASFRSVRVEMRQFREHVDNRIDAQGEQLRQLIDAQGDRIDAQGEQLRQRIDAQGEQLRKRIDAQSERIDAQGREMGEQLGLLRERMARVEGLLEGLRESITGKRAA